MHFVSKLSPEQWAEARRLRAGGASFVELARRFGIAAGSISTRSRREGWSTPGEAVREPIAGPRGAAQRPSPATADIRRRLAQRLYKVIEFRIRMMELTMQKQLQDLERDPQGTKLPAVTKDESESFAALIAQINQVTEMASEPASAADGRRKSAINPEFTALSDDIDADGLAAASAKEQLRREIADNLEKLVPPS